MLTGNYQVINQKIRVNANLSDTLEGKTLWSQKFDSGVDNLFDLLDKLPILSSQKCKYWWQGSVAPICHVLKGTKIILNTKKCNNLFRERNPDSNKQAENCISALLEKDPSNPVVLYLSGWNTFQRAYMG